jgi:spermidine synthase
MSLQQRKNLYSITVFLSSAMLMVLEIDAGRLIAPFTGSSLYSWTSIIGVVLAGLSLGNWLGGRLAGGRNGHRVLGLALTGSALTTLLVLPLIVLVAGPIQHQHGGPVWTSLMLVTSLFFLPALMLGIISPLATALYLEIDDKTGSVLGKMHALAATGSIFGTFITGYVLVQWLGTRFILVIVSCALMILAIPFLWSQDRRRLLLSSVFFAFILSGAISWGSGGLDNPCESETGYYCLRVVDEYADGTDSNTGGENSAQTVARTLVIDHMVHSTNVLQNPGEIWTPYVHAMDNIIDLHFSNRDALSYFFAGGGAFTHPRAVATRFPGAELIVSEIDPGVTEIAIKRLDLDPSVMTIRHQDTRTLLETYPGNKFDVVITDVFHDVGVPPHLVTREFNRLVASRLKDNGLYLVNVIDLFPSNQMVMSMYRTLKETFRHVGVWIERQEQDQARLTFVFSASNRPETRDSIRSADGVPRTWFNIAEFIEQQSLQYDAPILTDDYAPIEKLISPLLTSGAGH